MADSLLPKDRKKQLTQEMTLEPAVKKGDKQRQTGVITADRPLYIFNLRVKPELLELTRTIFINGLESLL